MEDKPTWPDWHYQPLQLSEAELQQPYAVINAFFECYTLPKARVALKQWLYASFVAMDVDHAGNVYLHDMLSKTIEACWILQQQPTGFKENHDRQSFYCQPPPKLR